MEAERAVELARVAREAALEVVDLEPRPDRALRARGEAQRRVLAHAHRGVEQQHRAQAERPHVVRRDRGARARERLGREEDGELRARLRTSARGAAGGGAGEGTRLPVRAR